MDRAFLIYTLKGSDGEWFRAPASVLPDMNVAADLPEGTTHYYINLIDENNFFVCYPTFAAKKDRNRQGADYFEKALKPAGVP